MHAKGMPRPTLYAGFVEVEGQGSRLVPVWCVKGSGFQGVACRVYAFGNYFGLGSRDSASGAEESGILKRDSGVGFGFRIEGLFRV